MNPNTHEERLRDIYLSVREYMSIKNTSCGGRKLLDDLNFKPRMNGESIIFVGRGTADDAEAVESWSDFCYR